MSPSGKMTLNMGLLISAMVVPVQAKTTKIRITWEADLTFHLALSFSIHLGDCAIFLCFRLHVH